MLKILKKTLNFYIPPLVSMYIVLALFGCILLWINMEKWMIIVGLISIGLAKIFLLLFLIFEVVHDSGGTAQHQ